MQQTLQLNIIPFNSPVKEITLPFSIGKQQGFYGLYLDDEVKELVGDKMTKLEYLENNRIYTDFGTPKENSFLLNIDGFRGSICVDFPISIIVTQIFLLGIVDYFQFVQCLGIIEN